VIVLTTFTGHFFKFFKRWNEVFNLFVHSLAMQNRLEPGENSAAYIGILNIVVMELLASHHCL
jgi:hypothetical protein